MSRLKLNTTRGLTLVLMFILWAVSHSMAVAGLQALDAGQFIQLLICSTLGSASLWLSWCCWVRWCWLSQQRPQACYRLSGGR